jgi:hypothetical protein
MEHLFDGGALEQAGQEIISLIVTVEVKVHVLMQGGDFFAHRLVEELDAVFVHGVTLKRVRLMDCKRLCIVLSSRPIDNNKGAGWKTPNPPLLQAVDGRLHIGTSLIGIPRAA